MFFEEHNVSLIVFMLYDMNMDLFMSVLRQWLPLHSNVYFYFHK